MSISNITPPNNPNIYVQNNDDSNNKPSPVLLPTSILAPDIMQYSISKALGKIHRAYHDFDLLPNNKYISPQSQKKIILTLLMLTLIKEGIV